MHVRPPSPPTCPALSPQPFVVEFAEPEHQLCGKTWQMAVQATNQYTPPSDWVDGPPPVNAPACPPTCAGSAAEIWWRVCACAPNCACLVVLHRFIAAG